MTRQIQKKVKVNGGVILYDNLALRFPINVGIGFSSSIFWRGLNGFEPHTWRVIKALATRKKVFVDVGAHFGFYSVLAHKVNPSISTISFEPIPELYRDCLAFHQFNGVNQNADVLHCALSDRSGKATIYVPKGAKLRDVRSASLQKEFYYNKQFDQQTLEISTITWDAFVAGRSGNQYRGAETFMKVDVEGHELAVLTGCLSFLRTERPIIVCEIDTAPVNVEGLSQLLEPLGYSVLAILPPGLFRIDFRDLSGFKGSRDFLLVPFSCKGFHAFDAVDQLAFEN